MFLTVHAACGTLIGQHSNGILLAFILGIISHYILDIIPHGDDDFGKKKSFVALASLDSIFAVILILFLFAQVNLPHPKIIAWGIAGSILPDITWALEKIIRIRPFKPITEPNHLMHQIIKKRLSVGHGMILQLIFLAIFVSSIFILAA